MLEYQLVFTGVKAILATLTQGQIFLDAKLQLSVAPAVLDKQHKEADNNVRSLNYLTKGLNAKHFEETKSANFLHTSLTQLFSW